MDNNTIVELSHMIRQGGKICIVVGLTGTGKKHSIQKAIDIANVHQINLNVDDHDAAFIWRQSRCVGLKKKTQPTCIVINGVTSMLRETKVQDNFQEHNHHTIILVWTLDKDGDKIPQFKDVDRIFTTQFPISERVKTRIIEQKLPNIDNESMKKLMQSHNYHVFFNDIESMIIGGRDMYPSNVFIRIKKLIDMNKKTSHICEMLLQQEPNAMSITYNSLWNNNTVDLATMSDICDNMSFMDTLGHEEQSYIKGEIFLDLISKCKRKMNLLCTQSITNNNTNNDNNNNNNNNNNNILIHLQELYQIQNERNVNIIECVEIACMYGHMARLKKLCFSPFVSSTKNDIDMMRDMNKKAHAFVTFFTKNILMESKSRQERSKVGTKRHRECMLAS